MSLRLRLAPSRSSLSPLWFALVACGGAAPAPAPSGTAPAASDAALAPEAARSSTESFTMPSRHLNEVRRINIYLPPGYVAGAARLPVLYMPDGGTEEDFPHVTATVERLIHERAIPALLVVGIENTERRRDLSGPTEVAKDREIAPRVGGSATFRAFLRDELMPEIGRRHCVSDDTAIIGESLAGLFIVETLLLEPSLFRRYVALSPSLWWNAERLAKDAAAHLGKLPASPRALYLASAGDDLLEGIVRFADSLRTAAPSSLVWAYHPRAELRHASIYRSLSAEALTALYQRPAVEPAAPPCLSR
jgi:predicted alpha/beta superfamily hydrolase